MKPIDSDVLFRLVRPSAVSLSDHRVVVDPAFSPGQLDKCTRDALLSMTPAQRARWNDYWRYFVRDCERRGIDVEAAVYGRRTSDVPM